jgi:hypothetical protein
MVQSIAPVPVKDEEITDFKALLAKKRMKEKLKETPKV